MTDLEDVILQRLDAMDKKLGMLLDFKSKVLGIVIGISSVGSILCTALITAFNHFHK